MVSHHVLVTPRRALPGLAALLLLVPGQASAVTVLLTRHNINEVHTWDSGNPGASTLLHQTQSNDADYNLAEGSTFGWVAQHNNDYFARFIVGNNVGLDAQYNLGQNGLTHYAYPKHVTVHNGEVVVMSRNDGTLWRYTPDGAQLGSVKTSSNTGQGMASAGDDLYVSLWTGGASAFVRYDAAFTVQANHANPTGMGNFNNIVDFVFDAGSGHFFGLATTGEGGTGTNATTVLEFEMGGMVIMNYPLPFACDGMGAFISTVCGDGKVAGGEACDDGNKIDEDACTNACELAACGDGVVQDGVEGCDDGNAVDEDACTNACEPATCGDGIVQDGVEGCDDGNDVAEDACTNACEPAACGDGVVQDGVEGCDDGNDIDDDECSNACVGATCGDGVVQPGEECDDPNDPDCVGCVIAGGSTTDATTTDATTTDATTDGTTAAETTTDATTSGDIPTTGGGTGTGGDSNSGDSASSEPTGGGPSTTSGADSASGGSSSGSDSAGEGPVDDGGCGCRSPDGGGPGGLLALLALIGFARPGRRRR